MKNKPGALQRLIHRFLMLRPVTAFFSPWIHKLDMAVFQWTGDRYSASELVGWKIVRLTTMGARTAQPRTMPLLALFDDEKIALIASSLGRRRNPGWYYNLKAHPECLVEWKGKAATFLAREACGTEYDKYWQLGVSHYAGFEKYQRRAGRKIPVMVLEPRQ